MKFFGGDRVKIQAPQIETSYQLQDQQDGPMTLTTNAKSVVKEIREILLTHNEGIELDDLPNELFRMDVKIEEKSFVMTILGDMKALMSFLTANKLVGEQDRRELESQQAQNGYGEQERLVPAH